MIKHKPAMLLKQLTKNIIQKNITCILSVIFLYMLLGIACKKVDNSPRGPVTPTELAANVYVAGNVFYGNNTAKAVYWKNGSQVALLSNNKAAIGQLIGVTNNNDVYTAGAIMPDGTYDATKGKAAIWKNDLLLYTEAELNTSTSGILDMGIIDNNVFVLISAYDTVQKISKRLLWQNGIVTPLSDTFGVAQRLCIANAGMFVAYTRINTNNNRLEVTITQNIGAVVRIVNNLQVGDNFVDFDLDGSNAWLLLYNNSAVDKPKVWTNGTAVTYQGIPYTRKLAQFKTYKESTLFTFEESSNDSNNFYIKNSLSISLENSAGSDVRHLFVDDDIVYAAGTVKDVATNTTGAAYWKNDKIVRLTSAGDSCKAVGIFVK
jgi:hypothetical protein